MATKTKIIDEMSFELTWPYEAGQTINEAEAKALNQVRSENIGNNLRRMVKEAKEAGKSQEEISAAVAKYDQEYVFTMASAGGGGRKMDPIEREARNLAKDVLKVYLAQTGRKLTVAPDGETQESWDEKVEAEIDRIASLEETLKEAKKNVAAKSKRTEALAQSIGL